MPHAETRLHNRSPRISRLGADDRSALSSFLRGLDRRTTHDYTHFGYEIEDPIHATASLLEQVAHGKTLAYAVLDGDKILGLGHLDFFARKEKRHVARLGVVVHQRYQGRGLGGRLLDRMIEDARRRGIEKIWLSTYADNPPALRLYHGRGFQVEGVFRKEEKAQGRYRDVISMALFLNRTRSIGD